MVLVPSSVDFTLLVDRKQNIKKLVIPVIKELGGPIFLADVAADRFQLAKKEIRNLVKFFLFPLLRHFNHHCVLLERTVILKL